MATAAPAQRSLRSIRRTRGPGGASRQRAIVEGGEEGCGGGGEWPRAALIGIIKPKLRPNPGRTAREGEKLNKCLDVRVVRLRSVV